MFCMECGAKLPDNAKFCMNCGTAVNAPQQEQSIQVSVETPKEVIDVKSESTPQKFKPFFLPNASNLPVKLHTQQSLQVFSKYLDNNTYRFPLGNHEVSIPEYMITAINTRKYFFGYVWDSVLGKFIKDYEAKVHDVNTLFKYGLQLMSDTVDRLAEETQKFLIASGILTVSEDTVRELIKRDYDNFQTAKALHNLVVLSKNIDANTKQGQEQLTAALKEANIIGAMTYDLTTMVLDCRKFYQATLLQEDNNVSFTLPYAEEEINRANTIRDNTIKHVTDKEQILANLSKSLTYNVNNAEALTFLTKYFARVKDNEILTQIKTIAEFLLLVNVYDKSIAEAENEERLRLEQLEREEQERKQQELEQKRKALEPFFSLPEETSENVRYKIEALTREGAKIGYDVQDNIDKLNVLLRERETYEEKLRLEQEKQQREAKLNAALSMPEENPQQILLKIEAVKLEAEKLGYDPERYTSEINERLKEAEEAENTERLQNIIKDILLEVTFLLNLKAAKYGVSKYFHGLVWGSEKDNTYLDKNMDKIYSLYAQEMDHPFKEFPILYYDDTLSGNAKDSVLVTPHKIYMANFGDTLSVELDDVEKYTIVNKMLSHNVLINDTFKISATLVDSKHLEGFTECIKGAVALGKILGAIITEDKRDGELTMLNNSEEDLKTVLESLREVPFDESDVKNLLIPHLYATNGHELLENLPERVKRAIESEKTSTSNKPFGTDEIIKAIHSVKIDNVYLEVGNPTIDSSSRKYSNAKRNLNIPDSEDIFLIYDATVLGGVRKGFALCTTGFYYCTSKPGYMDWNKFSKVPITKSSSEIKVAGEEFLCNIEKPMFQILTNLQERIKEN